jgi:hypothetical protein
MRPTPGTAATAQAFAVLLAVANPATAGDSPRVLEQQARATQKTTTRVSTEACRSQTTCFASNEDKYSEAIEFAFQPERLTTQQEKLIGEIRNWSLLGPDWDAEGAQAPSAQSIKDAVSFCRLLDADLLEPMLLASGNVSLYKNESDLYADIEFLGYGRIAYFIKRNGDKHKGVLKFDSNKMPAVFSALFSA